jgi:hypothetical protein
MNLEAEIKRLSTLISGSFYILFVLILLVLFKEDFNIELTSISHVLLGIILFAGVLMYITSTQFFSDLMKYKFAGGKIQKNEPKRNITKAIRKK